MIEALGAAARALGVLASACLIGTPGLLLYSGASAHPAINAWARRAAAGLLLAALLLIGALFLALLAQAAQILCAQSASGLLDRQLLPGLVGDTHFGRIWLLRVSLAAGLLLLLALAPRTGRPRHDRNVLAALLALAVAIAATAPLTGHAAGSERAPLLVAAHMLHIVALGIWLGGLPAWIGLVGLSRRDPQPQVQAFVARALQRFSRIALLCMACIVASGYVVADAFIEDQGDLLGTRYGQLLVAKLVLLAGVLLIADHLRRRFLPLLRGTPGSAQRTAALRRVRIELALAVLICVLGAWLAQTTPAVHDQPVWWLPLRIAVDATWPQWPSVPLVFAGSALLTLGALLAYRHHRVPSRLAAAVAVVLCGGAIIAWALAVPAYPDTFRRSEVPYLTDSIAHGRELFETHCVACHGAGGLGDGPRAADLPVATANLSEPHTALHTVGDMFWWFTHGMAASGMPGYADRLTVEQRWDLVNFLRAFSQGFEARVLQPQIQPLQPWLGAPVFYFEDASGRRADLKDFRRRSEVLLVFLAPDDARAQARSVALSAAQARLERAGVSLIGIFIGQRSQEPGVMSVPYPLLSGDDARQAWSAYELLSRTFADRGDADRIGMPWRHAEFLIDRFGYVRARWIPEDDASGWDDIEHLLQQAARLRHEPELRPPPDLHVH